MKRSSPGKFLLGIIEGFYGRAWSHRDRIATAAFGHSAGFAAYIYAPKADSRLRKRWREPWPAPEFDALLALAAGVKAAGLQFGIGLSPYGLAGEFNAHNISGLRDKLAAIESLNPDILCILFDDMPGDRESLAAEQLEICEFVAARTAAGRVIVCPTYYSFDPVLERVFGSCPPGYWSQLGAGLDPALDFFWTGDKVCSAAYPAAGLDRIAELFGRRPVLWDNYPVNDSASASRRLYLAPAERPASLCQHAAGVVANPMNQAWLSRSALAGLAAGLGGRSIDAAGAISHCFPQALAQLLCRDRDRFGTDGLDGIDSDRLAALLAQYSRIDHPAAREVCDWLQGGYGFDPACLTE